ncbi:piggyBac transposable element-derived protein 4-like [Littorina saxatilis]|uniref:piggyBac transposable element-derived protein 4-like n=1 Tax=Littorina saxatilis TaxID=31220 RepID=UPI0038B68E83
MVDFFDLVFSSSAIDFFIEQTNLYAQQQAGEDWDCNTDIVEMRAFIGMLFFIGVHRLPEMNNYFSQSWVLSTPEFSKRFTRRRWWQLWSNLHLADNTIPRPRPGQPGFNKLWKVQPLFDILLADFQEKYYIGQNVSVDEMMVKGKGKNPVKQYLPMKPIKRGTKIWALGCSCCAYMYNMQVYAGKVEGIVENGLAYRVVTDLCEPHLSEFNNHVVYLDNFFTSIPLSRHLESIGLHCVGTIRANRQEYPQCLKDTVLLRNLQTGEFHTAAVGRHIMSVWKDTKVVSFITNVLSFFLYLVFNVVFNHEGYIATITNVHPAKNNSTVTRKRKQDGTQTLRTSPSCVKDYNANMGAIDRSDQMRQPYGIDRESKRWWIRIFLFMLDIAMVNSHVIYTQWFKTLQCP